MENKNTTPVDPSVLAGQAGENTGIVPPVDPKVAISKDKKATPAKKADTQTAESDDFAEVFEANPDLEKIYVVEAMPFADENAAHSFAASQNRLLDPRNHVKVRMIARALMLLLMVLVSGSLMAQDVVPTPDSGVWDWIVMNKGQAMTAVLFVLGFLSRLFPTKYSSDVLKWLSVILDAIFGDKKASGGDFKTEVKDV